MKLGTTNDNDVVIAGYVGSDFSITPQRSVSSNYDSVSTITPPRYSSPKDIIVPPSGKTVKFQSC